MSGIKFNAWRRVPHLPKLEAADATAHRIAVAWSGWPSGVSGDPRVAPTPAHVTTLLDGVSVGSTRSAAVLARFAKKQNKPLLGSTEADVESVVVGALHRAEAAMRKDDFFVTNAQLRLLGQFDDLGQLGAVYPELHRKVAARMDVLLAQTLPLALPGSLLTAAHYFGSTTEVGAHLMTAMAGLRATGHEDFGVAALALIKHASIRPERRTQTTVDLLEMAIEHESIPLVKSSHAALARHEVGRDAMLRWYVSDRAVHVIEARLARFSRAALHALFLGLEYVAFDVSRYAAMSDAAMNGMEHHLLSRNDEALSIWHNLAIPSTAAAILTLGNYVADYSETSPSFDLIYQRAESERHLVNTRFLPTDRSTYDALQEWSEGGEYQIVTQAHTLIFAAILTGIIPGGLAEARLELAYMLPEAARS